MRVVLSAIIIGLSPWVIQAQESDSDLRQTEEVVVTATREPQALVSSSESVGIVSADTIRENGPAHPSEIVEQIPGVHVNVTGGEGHMTAIRQPITTSPVYLYVEDGVPVRSTGFFNHNALYEINVPQSGGIEILKGPGTALYGSDAVGGVINVRTLQPPKDLETSVNVEGGSAGWRRLLLSTGNTLGDNGLRADINLTHSDGWREATEYDRQSANLRWDSYLANGAVVKTVLSGSHIDQQTAGSSRISEQDYLNEPTLNYTPISYRQVDALRLSANYEWEDERRNLSVTPYVRDNAMAMIPNWSLSYDPTRYNSTNQSFGMLVKYRQDFTPWQTRVIVGADIDYSPGAFFEEQLQVSKEGNVYTDYEVGEVLYDYDVTYRALSPYVHVAMQPAPRLSASIGVRYDMADFDYSNNLTDVDSGKHRRPASTAVAFEHLSPKVGLSYSLHRTFNPYASYRHGFRVPSEGQLFHQGQAENTVGLQPIKVDSYELGARGRFSALRYELAVYSMTKQDDILSYRSADGTRETVNAGETSHQGVELGVNASLTKSLLLAVAYSRSQHNYVTWSPKPGVDYSGNGMESAPESVANVRVRFQPVWLKGEAMSLEWQHLGAYWMDAENTEQYAGHDLLNLRVAYRVLNSTRVFVRAMNLTDERYASAASYSAPAFGNPAKYEYAPGAPRSVYLGVEQDF